MKIALAYSVTRFVALHDDGMNATYPEFHGDLKVLRRRKRRAFMAKAAARMPPSV